MQVTSVINPALSLLSTRPAVTLATLKRLLPILLLGEQRHNALVIGSLKFTESSNRVLFPKCHIIHTQAKRQKDIPRKETGTL